MPSMPTVDLYAVFFVDAAARSRTSTHPTRMYRDISTTYKGSGKRHEANLLRRTIGNGADAVLDEIDQPFDVGDVLDRTSRRVQKGTSSSSSRYEGTQKAHRKIAYC